MNWQEEWKEDAEDAGLKYFVIKIEDFFNGCDQSDIANLDNVLEAIELYRRDMLKKKSNNRYWVVNRDEPYAIQVKEIIEKNEGIKLNE